MNKRKRRATLVLLAAFIVSGLALPAQAKETKAAATSAPSKLRASIKDESVILSWTDSPSAPAGYVVYRSEAKLDAGSFPAATRLGEIPAGTQSYKDSPPDAKPYFYGVFALSASGSPYLVFLPAQNITPVGLTAAPDLSDSERNQGAGLSVSALTAKAKGDAILLTYKTSTPNSRLVLYRGTEPIVKAADLLDASLVAAFADQEGSFTDFPVPGVAYYYAMLGEEDLKAGKILLTPGVNSLTSSVEVRASTLSSGLAEAPPPSRTPPLPYFLMENEAFGKGTSIARNDIPASARPISPETAKAIESLLASTPPIRPALPAVKALPEERAAPSGGEDYALSLIVTGKIIPKDWIGAQDQLRKYLSLNRSPKAAARAHFYLGESLVSTGASRDAFFEFLSAREFYPMETKLWIEYVLSLLNTAK